MTNKEAITNISCKIAAKENGYKGMFEISETDLKALKIAVGVLEGKGTEITCDSRKCVCNKNGKCEADQINIDLNGECIIYFPEEEAEEEE
jgi:hypothetical protein